MQENPSRNIRLFGTDQPVTPPLLLKAGALSAELEAGNLRYIRFNGVEVMRAISFIVRDKDWGTYEPDIFDLKVAEDEHGFTVRYQACTKDDVQSFTYQVKITGNADGKLIFDATGSADSDFLTNRTGFVILHPIDGVAGEKVEIEHVDGKIVASRFPRLIDPVQPMMELRRLTHWAGDGQLRIDCLMEGDTYEMEDQRNWTDASYKTYVRPLALPWPYTIRAGEKIVQCVTLSVSGTCEGNATGSPVSIRILGTDGKVPALGLGIDPGDIEAAQSVVNRVADIGAHHLICHFDSRRGHDRTSLEGQINLARKINATLWLEAVVASVDNYEAEISELGKIVCELGSPFSVVLVSPAPDLKCTLPGSVWPPAPPAEQMYEAARKAFPGAEIGGGMFSYFTELNRKRPPLGPLDLVSFTTSALVHAGDDRSVMETLQSLPAIAESAQAIAEHLPYAVGPSAIGMRDNPYGEAPKENPSNIRQAMNRNDPRQRGLLGAAWALGYFARFSYGGASHIAIGAPVGASGAVVTQADLPLPAFDTAGEVYPVFHILRGLAKLHHKSLRKLEISRSDLVQAIAAETESGDVELWLANLTLETVTVSLEKEPSGMAKLDENNFVEAAQTPNLLDELKPQSPQNLTLAPYAVTRIKFAQ